MDYQHINQAINLLQTAANHLQNMVQSTPPDRAKNQAVEETIETVKQALAEMTPMRRIGEPDEIVGAAIYLASRLASF